MLALAVLAALVALVALVVLMVCVILCCPPRMPVRLFWLTRSVGRSVVRGGYPSPWHSRAARNRRSCSRG